MRELLDEAFKCVGLDWHGYVKQDEQYLRPTEVNYLRGDPTKAKEKLGWEPKVKFGEIVQRMVGHEISSHRKSV